MFKKRETAEQKERKRLLENREWVDKNFDSLQKEFMDQWIAILDQKVVYNNEDVNVVRSLVEGKEGETVVIRIPSVPVQTPI